MRERGDVKSDLGQSQKMNDKFVVCDVGYPVTGALSFMDATLIAQKSQRINSTSQFSLYQVSTGIHFDVPDDETAHDEYQQPSQYF
jgi:hypothetical protein